MFSRITKICQDLLRDYPNADLTRDYLDNRLSREVQEEFQMGYFPSSINLLIDLVGEKRLSKSSLSYYKMIDGEWSLSSALENHNMVMPYKDAYGNIIAIVGRTILTEDERKILGISKYKNTRFAKANHLFGLDKAKSAIIKENCVFVVEGQFDCIRAISSGIENCVCLGSSSLSFNQFALLTRYTDNIIMLLDNDEAGVLGAKRAISSYGSKANIRMACVPDGYKDLDQFLESEGEAAKEFLRLIS